uniref:transmembrane protein 254 isoform X6 n=1 Tax=Nyctereutes procyonoides TaxID=34880 RepID=UPI00244404D3|nr:transmembrane protein 254 isoform X6 [Nyctereutes procyonoides]
MAPAAGGEAHFQRGSLPWFTAIALSFGYYTVLACLADSRGRVLVRHGFVQTGFSRRGAESSFVLSHPVDCCFSPTLALDEI